MHSAAEKLDNEGQMRVLEIIAFKQGIKSPTCKSLSFILTWEKQKISFCINFPKAGWGGFGKESVIFPPL